MKQGTQQLYFSMAATLPEEIKDIFLSIGMIGVRCMECEEEFLRRTGQILAGYVPKDQHADAMDAMHQSHKDSLGKLANLERQILAVIQYVPDGALDAACDEIFAVFQEIHERLSPRFVTGKRDEQMSRPDDGQMTAYGRRTGD